MNEINEIFENWDIEEEIEKCFPIKTKELSNTEWSNLLKLNDRVLCDSSRGKKLWATVIHIQNKPTDTHPLHFKPTHYTLQFDKNIIGHSGNGIGKFGHCWDFSKIYNIVIHEIE